MKVICQKCNRSFQSNISPVNSPEEFKEGLKAICPHCEYENRIPPFKVQFDSGRNIVSTTPVDTGTTADEVNKFFGLE